MFQIELAHWFYVDFYCDSAEEGGRKDCPNLGIREFTTWVFSSKNEIIANAIGKKTKNICYSSIMIFVKLVLKRISLFPYQKPNYHGFVKIANSPKPSSEEGQVL